jgi:hypothetical protein
MTWIHKVLLAWDEQTKDGLARRYEAVCTLMHKPVFPALALLVLELLAAKYPARERPGSGYRARRRSPPASWSWPAASTATSREART